MPLNLRTDRMVPTRSGEDHRTELAIVCCFVLFIPACKCAHDYRSEITITPTCCSKGTKTLTCTNCGDSYTEDVEATGNHVFAEPIITKEATCKETGIESYTCIISGKEYNREIKKTDDHEYTKEVIKLATDTVKGTRECTCSICGDFYTELFLLSKVKCSGAAAFIGRGADWINCWVDSVTV